MRDGFVGLAPWSLRLLEKGRQAGVLCVDRRGRKVGCDVMAGTGPRVSSRWSVTCQCFRVIGEDRDLMKCF